MLLNLFPKSFKLFGVLILIFCTLYAEDTAPQNVNSVENTPLLNEQQQGSLDTEIDSKEYLHNKRYEENIHKENMSVNDAQEEQPHNAREHNKQNSIDAVREKFIYISYENIPEEIYKNQIFELNVSAVTTKPDIVAITSAFENSDSVKILNPNNPWSNDGNHRFYNKFFVQALKPQINIPQLNVSFMLTNNKKIDDSVEGFSKEAQPVLGGKDYANVLAKSLQVKHFKTTRYNNTHNILVLEIDSDYGNLFDFKINNSAEVVNQGIDTINLKLPHINVIYYALIPIHWKNFKFEFFNINTLKFDSIEFPIVIDTENISTQSDLNPKDSQLEMYKVIILIIIAITLLVFAVIKNLKSIGFLAIILICISIYIVLPYKVVVVKSNTKIRLLPTKNSTIFYITNEPKNVNVMKQMGEYYKIMFDEEKIGWVHEKDVVKN